MSSTTERHVNRVMGMKEAATEQPTASTAQTIIDGLLDQGLSAKSVATYYNAWKLWCKQQGILVHDWPKAPTVSRRIIPLLSHDEAEAVIEELAYTHGQDKANAARLVLHAGLRIEVEALDKDAWYWLNHHKDHSVMFVKGKQGHEREVIVTDKATRKIKKPPMLSYQTARRAWMSGVNKTATDNPHVKKGKIPTLHSLRHLFAHNVYDKTRDVLAVKSLLGHSSVTTTERYLQDARASGTLAKLVGGG